MCYLFFLLVFAKPDYRICLICFFTKLVSLNVKKKKWLNKTIRYLLTIRILKLQLFFKGSSPVVQVGGYSPAVSVFKPKCTYMLYICHGTADYFFNCIFFILCSAWFLRWIYVCTVCWWPFIYVFNDAIVINRPTIAVIISW